MSTRKTQESKASVREFLKTVSNETRRKDAIVVTKLMETVSRKKPKMWGTSIVGCGKHFYTYANGQKGEICKIGFSPRAQSLVFYLGKFDGKSGLLKKLGKHRVGSSCLYINKLDDINLDILKEIFEKAYTQRDET